MDDEVIQAARANPGTASRPRHQEPIEPIFEIQRANSRFQTNSPMGRYQLWWGWIHVMPFSGALLACFWNGSHLLLLPCRLGGAVIISRAHLPLGHGRLHCLPLPIFLSASWSASVHSPGCSP